MTLGDLIERLRKENPDVVLANGFHEPDSYRGYYDELAFAPATNITIGAMLAAALSALGATYEGYKGGQYVMTEWTPCWIAEYGESGADQLSARLLECMLRDRIEASNGTD